MNSAKHCLLVPHYNHVKAITNFMPALLSTGLFGVIVDDGSDADEIAELRLLLADQKQFKLVEHKDNQGKGAAMMTGARVARELGFTHVLQIDADGQHDIADVSSFVEYSHLHPQEIISGAPVFADDAPKARVYGRKITDFWVAMETLSLGIKDSLCGFRVYPLDKLELVMDKYKLGKRMDFDTEVLVKSVWQGVQVYFYPTKVKYIPHNISHFHYLSDNLSLILLHSKLMVGMLIRSPKLIYWRIQGRKASSN